MVNLYVRYIEADNRKVCHVTLLQVTNCGSLLTVWLMIANPHLASHKPESPYSQLRRANPPWFGVRAPRGRSLNKPLCLGEVPVLAEARFPRSGPLTPHAPVRDKHPARV